jgi:hypothetical protein
MGTLVAMRYPTDIALGLADHTYVKCANDGKAWSCWGGKSGGSVLRAAGGSTARADAIAGHDEKAGIRCYLVNGVCHQSANRILLPASATVRGARGYRISEARFGVYGRPRGRGLFRGCVAPFNQYPGVTGDLHECLAAAPGSAEGVSPQYAAGGPPDDPEGTYLDKVRALYGARVGNMESALQIEGASLVEFMVAQFELRMDVAPAGDVSRDVRGRLRDIRADVERAQIELEDSAGAGKFHAAQYPAESDRLTLDFQKRAADALGARAFQALFELEAGAFVRLSVPDVAAGVYGPR